MNEQKMTWNYLIEGPSSEGLLGTMMQHVAYGLSVMVGQSISNDPPRVETVPIAHAMSDKLLYRRFHDALRPGGVLFMGGTEVLSKTSGMGFEALGVSFYRRNDAE